MNRIENENSVKNENKTFLFVLKLLYTCLCIFALTTSVLFTIFNVKKILLCIITEDKKAVLEMDKLNDFLLGKYNCSLREIRKYEYKYFSIPLPNHYYDYNINSKGYAVKLKNGKKINPEYVLTADNFPNKFKNADRCSIGSMYYLPFKDGESAEKKFDSLLKEDDIEYNIVNSGIFYYYLFSDLDKNDLIISDAKEYFSKAHNRDEYFDSIEEALKKCYDLRYAPDSLKNISLVLRKDEYEGGYRLCYMSSPEGIEGYLVEADIKVNTDGMFCVKSAKVSKYQKDWVNNAKYSLDKSKMESEDISKIAGFTGDENIKELLKEYNPNAKPEITEIPMDDRIIYFWYIQRAK